MPLRRHAPPMSLPVLSGRAVPPPAVMIEPSRANTSGSPSDIMRAVAALRSDVLQAEEHFLNYWLHLMDYLLEAATDTLVDGEALAKQAPAMRATAERSTPTLGGHRVPRKTRMMIQQIRPRPDPVSPAEIIDAIEQLRANLRLRLMQSAAQDQASAQSMAELLDVVGRQP